MSHYLQLLAGVVDYSGLPRAKGNTIQIVLNIVFGLSAAIALLMIVISGFRYTVAHGDPSATASAKNGVIYAVIGLVIVMAAYSLVTYIVKAVG